MSAPTLALTRPAETQWTAVCRAPDLWRNIDSSRTKIQVDRVGGRSLTFSCQPAPSVTPEEGGFRTSCWSAPERFMWMSRWMTRPGWVVSQTRVCDTGPQFASFSLFRGVSQRYSAIRTSWRESDARDLRLRPHQSLRAFGQRPVNPTPAVADCRRGAFSHLSGRRCLRYRQPAGLALAGCPAGSRRHLGY